MSGRNRQHLPSRREIVAGLPLLVAAALSAGCRGEAARRERARRLANLVGGAEIDPELAAACLAALPDTLDLDDALAGIHRKLGRGARFAADAEVLELAAERLAADADEGRWLAVDGWRLGELEARLCALAGLLDAAPDA